MLAVGEPPLWAEDCYCLFRPEWATHGAENRVRWSGARSWGFPPSFWRHSGPAVHEDHAPNKTKGSKSDANQRPGTELKQGKSLGTLARFQPFWGSFRTQSVPSPVFPRAACRSTSTVPGPTIPCTVGRGWDQALDWLGDFGVARGVWERLPPWALVARWALGMEGEWGWQGSASQG